MRSGFNRKRCALTQVDRLNSRNAAQASQRPLSQYVAGYAPQVLSILRIAAALLFLEHGTSRLFAFPSPLPAPELFSMYWFAGAIEFIGGVLLLFGQFT